MSRATLAFALVVSLIAAFPIPYLMGSQHHSVLVFATYLTLAAALLSVGDFVTSIVWTDSLTGVLYHTVLRWVTLAVPATGMFVLAAIMP